MFYLTENFVQKYFIKIACTRLYGADFLYANQPG